MAFLTWDGQRVEMLPTETVLDVLLRVGFPLPHSCRAGVCQSCLLRATQGAVPPASQAGLKPTLAGQGYFLACVCRPDQDFAAEIPGPGVRIVTRLVARSWLSDTVFRVALECDEPLHHRAGQYLTLFRTDGLSRSYSIASLPEDRIIELHVRVIPNGKMSNWLAGVAHPGTELTAQGPAGNCFYAAGAPEQPLLLVGTGTGLAPLYGIVRDALGRGHTGPIWLYHGALDERGLYLVHELEELAARHPPFRYRPALLNRDGPLAQVLHAAHPKLAGWRGYVCGDPQIVDVLKKRLFLAGMASREINSDAFVPTAPPG